MSVDDINKQLDPNIPESLSYKQKELLKSISELSLQLSAPQRAAEAYKLALKRWEAAGNACELAVYPEGPHGIDGMPTQLGAAARARLDAFLSGCLDD